MYNLIHSHLDMQSNTTIMDLITTFSNGLDRLLAANIGLMTASGDSINIKTVELREQYIIQLIAMSDAMSGIIARIDEALEKTRDAHIKELSAIPPLIDKLNKNDNIGWKIVGKKHKYRNTGHTMTFSRALPILPTMLTIGPKTDGLAPKTDGQTPKTDGLTSNDSHAIIQTPVIQTGPYMRSRPNADTRQTQQTHGQETRAGQFARDIKYSRIKFTEALYLDAIRVPTFNYVKQDGELYYVSTADHFAVKIAGKLLHGNIGMIYTDEKIPEKIKDCKFAESCVKRDNCDYYHDPLKFGGSKDHRNFIASSWLYVPPTTG